MVPAPVHADFASPSNIIGLAAARTQEDFAMPDGVSGYPIFCIRRSILIGLHR